MGISLFKYIKRTEPVVDEEQQILNAENLTAVVERGLEEHNLSEMNSHLKSIVSSHTEQSSYVFLAPSNALHVALIGILLILMVCCGLGGAFSLTVAVLSPSRMVFSLSLGISLLFIAVLNGIIIASNVRKMRLTRRYRQYYQILRFHHIELVRDLAAYASVPLELVRKDLVQAIQNKWVPQGHFSTDGIAVFLTDELFQKYLSKQAEYDQYFHKLVERRERESGQTREIRKTMELGETYAIKFREYKKTINDKKMAAKVERLETIINLIFHEVDMDPSSAKKLNMFLDYYLPTTDKLLKAYNDCQGAVTIGSNAVKMCAEIKSALDMIICGYEEIVNQIFREKEMDIVSDIQVMKQIIKRDAAD